MQATKDDQHRKLRPITAAEYHRMGELGIIGPDERVELLDGELIPMPPIGPEHAHSVRRLSTHLQVALHGRAVVSVQMPAALDPISEPQPDVMAISLPDERYATAHPTANDALLVVEVSKSSLATDRGRKLRAYARRGIREYWIVNLQDDRLDVYRRPRGERYASHRMVHRGETIAPSAFPEVVIAADEILPPPTAGV